MLLLGTLTNRRGQVVSAAWLTAEFPSPDDTDFALVDAARSAARRAGRRSAGTDTAQQPGRACRTPTRCSASSHPAVRHAQAQMHSLFAAAEADVAQRVDAWSRRLDQWEQEADA